MKLLTALAIVVCVWVVAFGSPLVRDKPQIDHHFESPKPILPMTFAHVDHTSVGCVDCHHDYVDDTGKGLCMNCHVTHADVAHLLEEQFHDLCRGCHTELAANNQPSGPPRQCIGCHLQDSAP